MVQGRPGSRGPIAALVRLSRPCPRFRHAVVFGELSGTDARGHAAAGAAMGGTVMNAPISLAPLLETVLY
jgi:hypothetical protein